MHLSITHLTTFLTVVQCGSMTGAATVLAYSLSTVSAHVSSLEKQLRTRLVVRSRVQCRPTREGRQVARLAESLLEVHDAIVEVRHVAGDEGSGYAVLPGDADPPHRPSTATRA